MRKVRGEEPADKPILLIYYKYMFMDHFEPMFKSVLAKQNYFDIYYTDDEKLASRFMDTNKFE